MAELSYRDAVIRGIAQEMARDPDVVFLGEDVAKAGGVFKATVGLYEQFGPLRVRDTPISEQAILGAAMGAAMTGLKPIAEIMFSDFFAVCFDYIANEFPKSRYMSNGQTKCPLVVRTGNGAGSRFGAQHSQSVENWCMMIPGLKVVAPSTPLDVIGLLAAAVRDPDPVIFLEHKSLYATKGEVPDGEIVDTLGTAKIVRPGKDCTIIALALMVSRALEAAEKLKAEHGIDCEVIDVRSLVPLAAVRLGRRDRVNRGRRGILRSRRAAGADHHAAYSIARRRYPGRHRAADARAHCRYGAAIAGKLE
jgi:pyruvate/2-oxoglutarate/acetoin dehydrogenase E1 component